MTTYSIEPKKYAGLRTHDMYREPEYKAWESMKARCYSPRRTGYEYYGAVGVSVCARWIDSFQNFFSDMGKRPTKKHSLDRIDCYGNYEPGNCRWATDAEQSHNKRGAPKGFSFHRGKYCARIKHEGKSIHLGRHETIDAAVKAHNEYIIENRLPHKLSVATRGLE